MTELPLVRQEERKKGREGIPCGEAGKGMGRGQCKSGSAGQEGSVQCILLGT